MKNMKIGRKLTIGFGMLLVFTVIITIVGTISIFQVNNNYTYVLNYPNDRYSILRDLESDLLDLRRVVLQASFSTGNVPAVDALHSESDTIYSSMRATIEEYTQSLWRDEEIEGATRNERLVELSELEWLIDDYMRHVLTPTFVAARADNFNQVSALLPLNTAISDDMRAQFTGIFASTQEQMDAIGGEMSDLAGITVRIVVALAFAAVAVGVFVAVLITRSITRPINRVASVISDVAKGNLNVNFDTANITKDEIGVLTLDIIGLVDVIKNMVDDLTKVHHEYIKVGNMHYTMDDSKYQNAYGEMIGLVNNLLSAVTADIDDVTNSLNHIADGNFNKILDTSVWVGEWVAMPNALAKLIDNLNSVKIEIGAMIDAASVKGDMSFQIQSDKYSGEWREIMEGLNGIGKAVDVPLQVLKVAIVEMKDGNFDLEAIDAKISSMGFDANTNNYSGIFKEMFLAFEDTVEAISSYINEINEILAEMASGDLRNRIDRRYVGSFESIKISLNNINDTLYNTMSEISSASEQVLMGASQISHSAQELADGAQEQASSVQELNAAIDIIGQQTQQNASNAMDASELSDKSTKNAQEGNEAMKQMLVAMSQIKESSNEISNIIKTIQEIAFQTNLLALNASVEAARAGEHGKGFSVVAEEVRNLAGRSQASATETTGLIETSNSRVESGSGIAETTSRSLDIIVKNVTDVSDLISNIAIASKDQSEAIAQIGQGLEQISRVTQNNSAVSEETAAASEELSSQATLLKQLVGYFRL